MKAYVITTGSVFALIVAAHVARVVAEGTRVLHEPVWVALTLFAAALAIWALVVWRAIPKLSSTRE